AGPTCGSTRTACGSTPRSSSTRRRPSRRRIPSCPWLPRLVGAGGGAPDADRRIAAPAAVPVPGVSALGVVPGRAAPAAQGPPGELRAGGPAADGEGGRSRQAREVGGAGRDRAVHAHPAGRHGLGG